MINQGLYTNFNKSVQTAKESHLNAKIRETTHFSHHQENKNDILLNWPLRGLAYTNEVGEALRPLSGTLATLMWIPALMYIGADTWDKYARGKNDDYQNPSKKQGIEQGIFQSFASVLLPTAAVKAGQGVASGMYGKHSAEGIDARVISELAEIVNNNRIKNAVKNGDDLKPVLKDMFADAVKEAENSSVITKMHRKLLGWFTGASEELKYTRKMACDSSGNLLPDVEKAINFIEKNSRKIIDFETNTEKVLKENRALKKAYNSVLKKKNINEAMKAATETLIKQIESKPRWIKVIGGFTALALAVKPIDLFVEHILIKKMVAPCLNMMEKKDSTK